MSPSARLDLLGGLRLRSGDVLDGGGVQRKRLALLAIVARAGARGVSRERLLALLWPDQSPEEARHALTVALSALRRALPEGALVPLPLGVALDAERVAIDVVEFEAALARGDREAAVACYGGPFLNGVRLPAAAEFDRWAEEERAALARCHVDALAALAASARERRDVPSAVRWAEAWMAADPLSARAAVALVDALAAAGDRSGAARAAQAHATTPARAAVAVPAAPPPPAEPAAVAIPAVGVEAEPAAPPRAAVALSRRRAGWRALVGGVAAVAAVAAAISVPSARPDASPTDLPRRVVVAPFANETGDTALAHVGRIAADWVAQGIATTGLVQVVPTSSAFAAGRYADSLATRPGADRARVLASETGAELVVSGGVYRVADSVQLRVVIADGRDGHAIRELAPVAAPVREPIPAVDRLRQRVLGALAPLVDERLAATAAQSAAPPSYEAYREMAEAKPLCARCDIGAALPHYERAYALDTSYTTALLHVALAHASLGHWNVADSLARRLDSTRHRLTPFDATLLDALRAWSERDWQAAYEAARRGAQIAPNTIVAAQVAHEALFLDRPYEAIRVLRALDPTRGELRGYEPYWVMLGQALHRVGDYEGELRVARQFRATRPVMVRSPLIEEARALAALGRVEAVMPLIDLGVSMRRESEPSPGEMMNVIAEELEAHGHAAATADVWGRMLAWVDAQDADARRSTRYRVWRGNALTGLGRVAEARAVFAAIAAEDTTSLIAQRRLGVAAARLGDRATADRAAARLARATGRAIADALYWRAQIAAQLGDRAGATELLRDAIGRGLPFYLMFFHHAPELEALRGYPPFEALVRPRG
jgi:DNA-binding SARP family transcriptional activator/TolB-like protein